MTPVGERPVQWTELWHSGHLPKFLLLCLGIWLHAAGSQLVVTVLPTVINDIGGLQQVHWTGTLYDLGSILAGVLAGFLVRHRPIEATIISAALVFAVGCVLAALAASMPVMIAARLLQGLGGGGMIALCLVALRYFFPERIWPQLIALQSAVWGVSAFCGPIIGALFATYADWRWAFWAFAAQAILLATIVWALPKSQTKTIKSGGSSSLPILNIALLATGIIFLATAGTHVSTWRGPLMIAISLGVLSFFVWRDGRNRSVALLPSRPFDASTRLGAGMIMVITLSMSITAFTLYGPLVMSEVHKATPLTIGYMVVLESVGWSLAAILFARSSDSMEVCLIRTGAIIILATNAAFAWVMPNGPFWCLAPLALLEGAAFGASWGFIIRRIIAAAPEQEKDLASSAISAVQRGGFAIGAALCGIVANWAGFANGASSETAQNVGFWVFFMFLFPAFAGVLAAFRLTRPAG